MRSNIYGNIRPDRKEPPVGANLPDPFFDSYNEEILTAYDTLNLIAEERKELITITINRAFLKKIVWSHIHEICKLADAHRH